MNISSHNTSIHSYVVKGMTCAHCVTSVKEELAEVPGVAAIELSLSSGELKVAGENVSDDAVRAAVEVAGYTVVES